jgi:hypothetical protein
VQNAASAQAHIAALIPESKLDVIYIPGLSKYAETAAGQLTLTNRFTYANATKSMFNMLLLDGTGTTGPDSGGEKWEQKQINFAQLPELMQQFLKVAAGAADITLIRLLQDAPSGLGSNGDSALHSYYDNIGARQRNELTHAMSILDEVIIRSALGARDPAIYYDWAPLWSITEKERAEIFKMKAEAAKSLVDLMPIEALSDAIVNRLIEDGDLPGLEAAMEEYGTLAEQEPSLEEERAAIEVEQLKKYPPGKPQPGVAKDAAPRTLYVRRDVINKAEITRWAQEQGFTDIVPDMHVTIAHSKTPVDWFKVGTSWSPRLEIPAGGPRQMERFGEDGKYIALLITASELVWRHREITEAGATWDWPEYQPHISIQVGGDIDLSKVQAYQGKIVLGPEIFEEVKP